MEVTEKRCTHCHEMKPASSYSKRKTSPDGLQFWCKECQSKSSKIRFKKAKEKRHNSLRKRLDYYRKYHGLECRNLDSDKRTAYLKNLGYKCLKCGSFVADTLEDACNKSFICSNCSKTPVKRYSRIKKLTTVPNKVENTKKASISFTDKKYNLKKELYDILSKTSTESDMSDQIKVVFIPVPQQYIEPKAKKPKEKKSGIFGWVKRLFH